MENISESEFLNLVLLARPILDVRAPVEFNQGSIPGSKNAPILTDIERDQIGKVYKQKGNEAATQLGYQLVSGENREQKLNSWKHFANENPNLILTCFRGGQRSQIAQKWLEQEGLQVPRILGGYKSFRQFLMKKIDEFSEEFPFLLISGPTGSGKTHFLNESAKFAQAIDLEGLAHHKGSAFGKEDRVQPVQVNFENLMAYSLIKSAQILKKTPGLFLVEDESRMIGRCVQPDSFFQKLRQSPVLWLEVDLEKRVENIFNDYVQQTAIASQNIEVALKIFDRYETALNNIQRRLGGLRHSEISKDLSHSKDEFLRGRGLDSHRIWIRKLLIYYYDPLYEGSLEKRNPNVWFKGEPAAALEKIKSQQKSQSE